MIRRLMNLHCYDYYFDYWFVTFFIMKVGSSLLISFHSIFRTILQSFNDSFINFLKAQYDV